MRTRSVATKILAATLVLGLVSQVQGSPGDVTTMPAPMLGADPPAATPLQAGDSSVSTQTGALQYSYPIQVPPGRLGNQPQLALSYSSQAPIYGGIAAGWSLSIPEIRRDTAPGVLTRVTLHPDDWSNRKFISTMAGSRPLIPVTEAGTYPTYRAQNDTTYTRYQRLPQGSAYAWIAYGSDGTTYFFGDTSMVTGGVDEDRLPLTRTIDQFGNTVEYRWIRDVANDELRIDKIEYASNPGPPAIPASSRVQFTWEEGNQCSVNKVGSTVSYRTGELEVEGAHRLAQIKATAFDPGSGTTLHTREINLDYQGNVEPCGGEFSSDTRQVMGIRESAWGLQSSYR